jgi:micrococcal nuclease
MWCCWSKKEEGVRALEQVEKKDAIPYVVRVEMDDDRAKVVEVYDGDTCTVVFYCNNQLVSGKIRLLGIDAPEIKGKTEQEKAKAVVARDALRALVLNKVVRLSNVAIEAKWGRILADIWLGEMHVNDHMLQQGHAVPYGGKHGLTKTHVW